MMTADSDLGDFKRRMLDLRGTTNQIERYHAALLPDDELLALARTVLFAPFAGFKRWEKLTPRDLRHEKGCRIGVVTFDTRPAPSLTADEWTMLNTIRDVVYEADENVLREHGTCGQVDIIEHFGTCEACSGRITGRSASIRIEWAGHPLSREYRLEVA